MCRQLIRAPAIRSLLRDLAPDGGDEGVLSHLLARAGGFEFLTGIARASDPSLTSARGGLAPWAKRRTIELMQARLSEDITVEELAAQSRLSVFHFARMFKQSVGVAPHAFLTCLRVEKACELFDETDFPPPK
jgi:AraC family transcriptional regulator